MKHKLESRLLGEISITSDDTTLMAESEEELKSLFIMRNAGLEEAQAGIKIAGRNVNNLAQTVKRLSTMRETWVNPWVGKIRWGRKWQPTPVLLPGKSHGQRSLIGYSPWGRKESDMTEQLHFHFSLSCIGEQNGNPFQCSCLENPRDGGAWWAVPSMGSHRIGHD